MSTLLVAIDGPAGSGKSSVARETANRLNFGMLDTGAGYRSLTWAALDQGIDLDNEAAVLELMDRWENTVSLTLIGEQRVQVFNQNVTRDIRDPHVSSNVSRISKHPHVRERINELFRTWVADSGLPGVVIEGRDITTVVAPDAPVRIILTASPEVRAARRAGELPGMTREQVAADLAARDAKDMLVVDFVNPAPGVVLIDTSDLDFEESVSAVIDVARSTQQKFASADESQL
ncbi:MAG: (d)CMP kinase [Canibacter sp.]